MSNGNATREVLLAGLKALDSDRHPNTTIFMTSMAQSIENRQGELQVEDLLLDLIPIIQSLEEQIYLLKRSA